MLPCWFILAFVLWRAEFSIHRYLAVLEVLTGTMIAMAVFPIARWMRRPGLLLLGSATLLAACLVITVFPRLQRTDSSQPFVVDVGDLPSNSMVLILDNEPMAYLAAFVDPRIRFIGTNDFYMSLDGTNPMQRDVERAIAGHDGPLFGSGLARGAGRSQFVDAGALLFAPGRVSWGDDEFEPASGSTVRTLGERVIRLALTDKRLLAFGGWGGIRTHGTLARSAVFKTAALNRSATHPVSPANL